MPKGFVTFHDFLSLPVLLFYIIGVDPYDSKSSKGTPGRWFIVNYLINMTNLSFNFIMEFTFVALNFNDTDQIANVCMNICYFSYVLVSQLKTLSVLRQRSKLSALVSEMESIFPAPSIEEQQNYQVDYYLKRCQFFQRGFSGLYLILFIAYSFYSYVGYIIKHYLLHNSDVEKGMPFYQISPWNWHDNWSFYLMYMMQAMAAFTSTSATVSADLLIYAVNIQLVMHFDYLSRSLKEFQIQAGHVVNGNVKDIKMLQELVSYHNKLLGISDVMNTVFGIALLLNFLTSSVMVCFVGFQMTLGLGADQIVMLALFLISAVSEIYLICYCSDLLIGSSQGVFLAVYEMNWYKADLQFKKMLIFMAQRSQKPACLKATVFLEISMQTMTMYLKMSYRLFCVIRTMFK